MATSREAYEISQSIGNLWGQWSGVLPRCLVYLESGYFGKAIEATRKSDGLCGLMEIEAKFLADTELLKRLTSATEVAGWPVAERSWLRLETVYYDTTDRRLAKQDCALRLRRGEPDGTVLSFKRGRITGEISRREESEVVVPADYDPARPAFRPQPFLVAEWIAGGLPLAPALILTIDRTVLAMISGVSRLKLCLDRVSRPDRPDWRDYEIEVELHTGSEAGLTAFIQAFHREYHLMPSASSKAERAIRADADG